MINIFLFVLAFIQAYWLYRLMAISDSHAARITALEQNKPKAVVSAPQPTKPERQIFEKPVIPGAKEVKPFQIGDGKLKFDEENQVAEWI
jgi:hypothetical protein